MERRAKGVKIWYLGTAETRSDKRGGPASAFVEEEGKTEPVNIAM